MGPLSDAPHPCGENSLAARERNQEQGEQSWDPTAQEGDSITGGCMSSESLFANLISVSVTCNPINCACHACLLGWISPSQTGLFKGHVLCHNVYVHKHKVDTYGTTNARVCSKQQVWAEKPSLSSVVQGRIVQRAPKGTPEDQEILVASGLWWRDPRNPVVASAYNQVYTTWLNIKVMSHCGVLFSGTQLCL
jgi:hypothetical protein